MNSACSANSARAYVADLGDGALPGWCARSALVASFATPVCNYLPHRTLRRPADPSVAQQVAEP
jgi:hypothetical protein